MFRRVILLIKNQTFMKKVLIAASAAIILAAGAATCWTMYSGSEDEFFNENLEALMDGEGIIGLCDKYCSTMSGYVCVLNTSAGYDINCVDMKAWYD